MCCNTTVPIGLAGFAGQTAGFRLQLDTFVEQFIFSYVFVSPINVLISANRKNPPKHTLSDRISDAHRAAVREWTAFCSPPAAKAGVMNQLVGRIRAEFLEMPGLRLTV